MSWFQTFPGTSGFYSSREDTNILDSDTSHLHQTIGTWGRASTPGSIQNPALSGAVTPVFGDNVGQTEVLDSTQQGLCQASGITVSGSTEYTLSVQVSSDTAAGTITILAREFSGGGFVTSTETSPVIPTSDFSLFELTVTTAASTDEIRFWIRSNTNTFVNGDQIYWDTASVRLGSDGTFVPSIRVVGDLDLRAKLAVASVANYTIFTNGEGGGVEGFGFLARSDGRIRLTTSTDTGLTSQQSNTGLIVAGEVAVFKATYNLATDKVDFYKDDVLDVQRSPVAATAVIVGTGPGYLGTTNSTTDMFNGDIYWVEVRDGIDGPIVAGWYAYDAWTAAQ